MLDTSSLYWLQIQAYFDSTIGAAAFSMGACSSDGRRAASSIALLVPYFVKKPTELPEINVLCFGSPKKDTKFVSKMSIFSKNLLIS